MSINWDTPVSELMHSDDTIGLFESDEELMHFKYIKREKKNGKWVYYYDESALTSSETAQRYRNTKEGVREEKKMYEQMKKEGHKKTEQVEKHYKSLRRSAAGAAAQYAIKKVSSFPERTISRGLVKLGNLLSGRRKKK
jgi:hypothetical protein